MFLRNPLAFKKQYIIKVYDSQKSPSSVVGSAAHKAVEAYLNGKTHEEAKSVGMDYINNLSETGINYGKTGSRAQIIAAYSQAVEFYFAEFKMPHRILGIEEKIVAKGTNIDGQPFPMPLKAVMDVISENELGEIEIIDHKFVKGYTDPNSDDFSKFIQAMFNYFTVKEKYGKAPARIIFNECKIGKNKDGSAQIRPWVFEFDSPTNFVTFFNLFNHVVANINLPGYKFLPSPGDIFDGQNSFEVYRMGIIGVDAPVSVKHVAEERKFVEKNFIPSTFDQVENEAFTPESKIASKLLEFGVSVKPEKTYVGPSVTKYTFQPARGIQMSKVARFSDDIALALSAPSVRIEAPIYGTSLIGVEVPNENRTTVELSESHFKHGTTQIPVGVDVYGETHYKDLKDMPHLLIAGATGSGKSVMLNVILKSLTVQNAANKLKLVLIDPKQVELTPYNGDPHLKYPVITDPLGAVETLDDMVKEMERRYKVLSKAGVRSIEEYSKGMPKIVVVVDEFADLMMSDIQPSIESMDIKAFNANLLDAVEQGNGKLTQKATKLAIKRTLEVSAPPSAQDSIIRLAQKSRAVGIHLILATQRPSAEVVTGAIKANIPTKIAFMATSQVNSKIILDQVGAETLTGKGDMLFLDPSSSGVKRLQGLFV